MCAPPHSKLCPKAKLPLLFARKIIRKKVENGCDIPVLFQFDYTVDLNCTANFKFSHKCSRMLSFHNAKTDATYWIFILSIGFGTRWCHVWKTFWQTDVLLLFLLRDEFLQVGWRNKSVYFSDFPFPHFVIDAVIKLRWHVPSDEICKGRIHYFKSESSHYFNSICWCCQYFNWVF